MYLAGEWVHSNLLFSASFLVAGLGVFGLGFWVLRGDRLNRELIDSELADELVGTTQPAGQQAPAAGQDSSAPAERAAGAASVSPAASSPSAGAGPEEAH